MTNRFGLEKKDIHAVTNILLRYPQIQKAVLYGSRAKGSYKKGSDIDLTLIGGNDLTLDTLYRIMEDLDNLMLPYTFDISLLRNIKDPDILDHIQRVGITFYQKGTA